MVTLQSLASELFGVFDDRDYIFVRSVSDTCTAVLTVPSLVVEACINLSLTIIRQDYRFYVGQFLVSTHYA